MPPVPRTKAKWTVDPKSVKMATGADGTFTLSCTVLDNGTPLLTPTLTITADRVARMLMHGESPAAALLDYQAWSDF